MTPPRFSCILAPMSLLSLLKPAGPSGYGYGTTAEQATAGLDLLGRTYVVTGCNSGLGLETIRVLGLRGAHIVALARTLEKAEAALGTANVRGTPVACELSEPTSVRAAVATIAGLGRRLDGILCNAGIMALPSLQLQHGIELQFFTNHIGHFMLVTGLVDSLTEQGRVVMLSSDAHRAAPREGIQFDNLDGAKGYGAWRAYGQAKLANLLFAKALARRFEGTSRTANAVHPGVIATNLTRHMNPVAGALFKLGTPLVLKSVPEGAATTCYVAAHPQVATSSGLYFADCNPRKPSRPARDAALAERLWTESEAIVARLP